MRKRAALYVAFTALVSRRLTTSAISSLLNGSERYNVFFSAVGSRGNFVLAPRWILTNLVGYPFETKLSRRNVNSSSMVSEVQIRRALSARQRTRFLLYWIGTTLKKWVYCPFHVALRCTLLQTRPSSLLSTFLGTLVHH